MTPFPGLNFCDTNADALLAVSNILVSVKQYAILGLSASIVG